MTTNTNDHVSALNVLRPHLSDGPLRDVVDAALSLGDAAHLEAVAKMVISEMPQKDQGKAAIKAELLTVAKDHVPTAVYHVSIGQTPHAEHANQTARERVIFDPSLRHVLIAPDQADRMQLIIPQRALTSARGPEHWLHRLDPWLSTWCKEMPGFALTAELEAYQRAKGKP